MPSDVKKLVDTFALNAVAANEALERGERSTKYVNRYISAFRKLVALGDKGRDSLAFLLEDPRSSVRVPAAAFLLRHAHERARAVLEAEAAREGVTALQAEQALARWADGTWALDPVP